MTALVLIYFEKLSSFLTNHSNFSIDYRVVVAVENVNTHKPEWFPEPVPNETVEIEEELEETDFVVLKVNARDQDVGSDNSRIGSVLMSLYFVMKANNRILQH